VSKQDFFYFGSQQTTTKANLYRQLVTKTSGLVAIDVETMSLDDTTPIGIGFAISPTDVFYLHTDSPLLPRALEVLSNPNVIKIIHNAHFDLDVIHDHWGHRTNPIVDTIIAAQLIGLPPALGTLAEQIFGIHITPIRELIGKGKATITMDKVPIEKTAQKCALDVQVSYLLWELIAGKIPATAFALEMRTMPVIMAMERRGMAINEERLDHHIARIDKDVRWYRAIARGQGFNPGSSKQLAAILQSRGWPIKYNRDTGNPVMDKNILENYYAEDPLASLSMIYRGRRVLLTNTLLPIKNKFLVKGRIHPRYHQQVAATGRLTSTKPNGMNITEDLRDIIQGPFEDWDLSQIELRVLAYVSQDPAMMAVFADPTGDIHSETAKAIFGKLDKNTRFLAKAVNFTIVYDGDENTLYQSSKVPLDAGKAYIAAYFRRFPGVKAWIESTRQMAHDKGYTETLMGRRRTDPQINDVNPWKMARAERMLINHPIQGTAGEILKLLMVRLADTAQVNAIHDETLMETTTTPNYGVVYDLAPFATPMTIKRGPNWKDVKEIAKIGY